MYGETKRPLTRISSIDYYYLRGRMKRGINEALQNLGLTGLEAEIYAHLLSSSALTGYAIARQIGKPTANTYKALDSLVERGAVLMEYGKTRVYRAISVTDLLASLEQRHRMVGADLIAAAGRFTAHESDDRVYQIGSVDQLFQQFRQMLQRATKVAVFDLFPRSADTLKDDLRAAASRGVKTVVKIYSPVDIPGVDLVLHTNPTTLQRWPGEWANGVVDGTVYQVAFLSRDCRSVRLAVRSESPYLAWMYHHGLVSELMTTAVSAVLQRGGNVADIEAAHDRYRELLTNEAPGLTTLRERFTDAD